MKGEWCYFKSHFSPEECSQILEDGLNLPEEEGKVFDSRNNSHRRSKVRFIQKEDPKFEWLFKRLWEMAEQANQDWFNFDISRITFIQLAEYSEEYEGEYKQHHDVFFMNPGFHRKLSAVVQLTAPEEYSDCDLKFYNLNSYPDAEEIRNQGTVIFFPSFEQHSATKITRGKRYSLAGWFEGPHFK